MTISLIQQLTSVVNQFQFVKASAVVYFGWPINNPDLTLDLTQIFNYGVEFKLLNESWQDYFYSLCWNGNSPVKIGQLGTTSQVHYYLAWKTPLSRNKRSINACSN